ncbi:MULTISPECIES: DNA internalization-related competence protein ComEC/Rec2 [unclassified Mannheimia]|uniref:DNA internalization-related competence protein ComEC/Rec2 n=1 Tax=unclassified Mannheimia TaxID=2645054 RepID=UPI00359DD394
MMLDRFCIALFLFHLPILLLPRDWLIAGITLGGVILIYSIYVRAKLIFLLGMIICVSYFHIFQVAKNVENITASKQNTQFKISKILKQTDYQTAIATLPTGENIYLNWQAEQPLLLNHYYQAELTLRPISARSNISNFDRQRWYFANHIHMTATARKVEKLAQIESSFRTDWLHKVKADTENLPTQGLLLALAFGERAWLKTADWGLFQQTATAHLIAISGLHIGLAMLFGFYLAKSLQWFCLKSRLKWLQAVGFSLYFARIVGFLTAFVYSYLAGFAEPTVRALFAIAFVLLCQYLRRHYTAWQLWWRIVALLVVIDPLSLLSDSFWLSVLAVVSLILWYQIFPLNRFISDETRKKMMKFNRLWLSLLHLQIGIWLVFSPVQLYFFEGVSAFALLANLIIVPLYSFLLVPLILFSLLTDNLFSTWQLADYLAQESLWLLTPLSNAWFTLSYWQQWQLLSLNLLVLLCLYCKVYELSYKKWLSAVTLSILFNLSFYLHKWASQAKSEWIMFDVGQGLAMALIYEQNKAVIYDTGSSWQSGDGKINSMAKLEILPYLKRNGISVEAIFLSHDDNDHSGGVVDLLSAYPNARLISSSKVRYRNVAPEPCIQGKSWQFGEWHLSAFYPSQIVERAKNHDSCIILAKNDRLQILLTGDSGIEQERRFAPNIRKIDFLQVGHHGSKSSTSETLLALAEPQFAFISAGRWNPWKLPNKQVVERLERKGIEVLNTAKVGMIRVKFYQNSFKIMQARDLFSPWYKQFY